MTVLNLIKICLAFATAALIVGTGTVAGLFWHFSHGLPDHKQLADYQPATLTRLYAADGKLLAEYAREKRVFVPVAAMPKRVLEAFVAAEDQRFFTHPGIDFIGVLRAVVANVANPGKRPEGGDRVPAPDEIANCSAWLEREFALLQPTLVLPVGKLAISQFLGERPLIETIGKKFPITYRGHATECIPLPHPSGASPWHRMEPGRTLLNRALALVAKHEAVRG